MIVVDASAIVDLLVGAPCGRAIAGHLRDADEVFAPELLIVEVASALWRLERAGTIPAVRAQVAVDQLGELPVTSVPHEVLLPGAWARRQSLRIADAFYVALADQLDVPLLTSDRRLARGARGISVLTVT